MLLQGVKFFWFFYSELQVARLIQQSLEQEKMESGQSQSGSEFQVTISWLRL